MSEKAYTQSFPVQGNNDIMVVSWPTLANGDTGTPFTRSDYCDRSIQVEGTYGAGGTVLIEGSNESTPTNWRTLNDPFSNALSITTSAVKAVTELVYAIRPRVSAGDGTTSLTISMIVRKE